MNELFDLLIACLAVQVVTDRHGYGLTANPYTKDPRNQGSRVGKFVGFPLSVGTQPLNMKTCLGQTTKYPDSNFLDWPLRLTNTIYWFELPVLV